MAGERTGIRIVVTGDRGTGKSSLIAAVATESFPENVPPVLPPTRLPADFYPDGVPFTIIDTSSSVENRGRLFEELKRADAVVLTYACDQPMTLTRLSTFWLVELHRLEVKVPVIVVGCKLDLRDEQDSVSLEQIMGPIMQQFREIETCIECSAATLIQVPDVFYYAQRAVLHPTAPLYDQETQSLKPLCIRALRRIFILCDHDMDGALSDAELNEFQVKCFNAPLQPAEIVGVKSVVQEKEPGGVNDLGLTLTGFLYLHALFIEKGRLETTWAVLRKFGYNNDLKLKDDFLPVSSKHHPDQSVELTSEVVEFLHGIFQLYDTDNDGALQPNELRALFDTAPKSPWDEAPYEYAAERTAMGNLTIKGFLSGWALMTMLDPPSSLGNLIYIGYGGNPASAFHVTRRRTVDRKKHLTERNVFHCFVFGPKKSGKSALLSSFLGRPFPDNYTPTTCQHYATNVVDQLEGTKKTLILQEIPEDGVKKFLSNKEALAVCDVAVFVYDSSDEYSWKRSKELLLEVARQGEGSGYGVPCLLIAAKDDLNSCPISVQDSIKVTLELGIEAPIPVSVKLRDFNNIFFRIVSAAESPNRGIPETQTGRNRKHYRQLVNRSLMFVSVGSAVAIVGLAAYRAYEARKNSS
ncbi:EF_assoc_1 domain-containing protein/EF_assoc_2 domain-containing protein/Miro domain-containing protein/EF_hand_4 domain-containing protein [Cephalotus follicularis]|uniref:Mitochondrial Rho GTPase n=1 Tax=Cephalotus follicularis TaxID=3775 RepID=A0A1Q3DB51_CEPFO|nr:EF_assoc_1 domain-containing protein/EF_assoc_2 domain-containing protein/Miro domain-containing protein/EF_hand_4 domain-containing protein [Cephalotus follicularis]